MIMRINRDLGPARAAVASWEARPRQRNRDQRAGECCDGAPIVPVQLGPRPSLAQEAETAAAARPGQKVGRLCLARFVSFVQPRRGLDGGWGARRSIIGLTSRRQAELVDIERAPIVLGARRWRAAR